MINRTSTIVPSRKRNKRAFARNRTYSDAFPLVLLAGVLLVVQPGGCKTVQGQTTFPEAREAFPDLNEADWEEMAAAGRIDSNRGRLARMVIRSSNIPQSNWQVYRKGSPSLTSIDAGTGIGNFAGAAYRLTGSGKTVSKITLDRNLQQAFDCKALYVVEGESNEGLNVVVVTNIIPDAWKQAPIEGQPFQCWGCLTTIRGNGTAILISPRIEWYPDKVSTSPGIDQAKIDLASAGLDIGKLNQITNQTLEAFSPEESDVFESLLRALKNLDLAPPATQPAEFNLLGVLQTPGKFVGNYVELQGTVRRVTQVYLPSDEMKQQLDQDSYFHVDLFLPIGNQSFDLRDTEGAFRISGSYGVTLIVLDWPFPMDKEMAISIPGYFVKNWKHKTVASREVSRELRRPNPIIFGVSSLAKIVEADRTRNRDIEMTLAWFWGGLVILVGLLTGLPWLNSRRRRQDEDRFQGKTNEAVGPDPNAGVSLSDHLRQFEDSQELRQSGSSRDTRNSN